MALGDIYFFDLPVYRLAYDTYNTDRDRELAAQLSSMRGTVPGYEPSQGTKTWMAQHQYEKYGPWQFNEIIGYIRLHFLGSQVRGEYFSAEKKRNPLSRHRVFTFRTHKLAPESQLWNQQNITNEEIFATIAEYVADCKKELIRGRVIDESILSKIGPHVDWRGLLGWKSDASSAAHPPRRAAP